VTEVTPHNQKMLSKQGGIEHFAAFVANARQMVLFWTPSYFTRLWCTMECATLIHIATQMPGRQKRLPLVFYPVPIAMQAFNAVCCCTAILVPYSLAKASDVNKAKALLYLLPVILISALVPFMHTVRGYMRDRILLAQQLTSFSIEEAGCFSSRDRAVVYKTVREWFQDLETFNTHVRTTLQQELLQIIGAEAKLSTRVLLNIAVPFVCDVFDRLSICVELGA